jgi:hypothetical protein
MFDLDNKKYPKSWKEMSFDFKLFFVFHGCMMVLFMVTGPSLLRCSSGS